MMADWNRDPLAIVLLIATGSAFWPLGKAWIASRGLPLRSALAWAFLAIGLAVCGGSQSLFEPMETGRPISDHWIYLACLASLAAMISVFNARTPGGGAWALLMGMLVLLFLIPWLEGTGLAKGGGGIERLRLEMPWSLFFALVSIAGVSNYLPTHFGPAAALLGLALTLEMAGLLLAGWPAPQRAEMWSVVPALLSATCWMARFRSRKRVIAGDGLTRLWLWFRDHWGTVWALRILDRFNRAAEASGWPMRMTWQGPRGVDGSESFEMPPAAEKTLSLLLRRFAPAEILESVVAGRGS